MTMKRPVGVVLVAVAAIALGAIDLLVVGLWWSVGGSTASLPDVLHVALFLVGLGVGELVFACGAWMLRRWALTFGIALEVIALVLAVGDPGRPVVVALKVVIAGCTLWYLAMPRSRVAFGGVQG
jgi:hypothetical protein